MADLVDGVHLGRDGEALAAFERSLEPRDDPSTWRHKADTLRRLGRAEEARAAAVRAGQST